MMIDDEEREARAILSLAGHHCGRRESARLLCVLFVDVSVGCSEQICMQVACNWKKKKDTALPQVGQNFALLMMKERERSRMMAARYASSEVRAASILIIDKYSCPLCSKLRRSSHSSCLLVSEGLSVHQLLATKNRLPG